MRNSTNSAWLFAAAVLLAPVSLVAQTSVSPNNRDEEVDIRDLPAIGTLSSDKTTVTICSIDGKLAAQGERQKLIWSAFKGPSFDSLHVSSAAILPTDAGNISGLFAAYNEATRRFVAVQLGEDDQQTVLKDKDGKLVGRVQAGIKATLAVCKNILTSAYASWESAGKALAKKALAKEWPGSNGEIHKFGVTHVQANFPSVVGKRRQFIPQEYEDIRAFTGTR